jgi:hypothetical protein
MPVSLITRVLKLSSNARFVSSVNCSDSERTSKEAVMVSMCSAPPAFSWGLRKATRNLRVTSNPASTRTKHPQNSSLERYRYANRLCVQGLRRREPGDNIPLTFLVVYPCSAYVEGRQLSNVTRGRNRIPNTVRCYSPVSS